jgi:glycosyltransferase involved in cell wall biosynthesis
MTYAEKQSIRGVINDFFATGVIDEVVVINNNAEPGTETEVAATAARQVFEPRQGYGFATRRGLAEATGDIVVLAEPDGTFMADDVLKLLAYTSDFDAVFGSRTFPKLIWRGANMGWPLKWGNWAVAKLMTVLFHTSSLSDVGCTYKALSRETVDAVLPTLQIGGSELGPELMVRTILSGARYVEIPVNYLPRVGTSSVTGDLWKAALLGLRMIGLILRMRLLTLGHGHAPCSFAPARRTTAHLARRRRPEALEGALNLDASYLRRRLGLRVLDLPADALSLSLSGPMAIDARPYETVERVS